MSPVRLAILAALGYILYRLLKADGNKKRSDAACQCPDGKPRVDDVLMEDPVCHTYVPAHDAETLERDGETYYFCSHACKEKFKKGASV